jgi:hypothetical protein
VTSREAGNTIWVYLPYAMGRQGNAEVKEKPEGPKYDLDIEYSIASFNPYRIAQPPELTFVVQQVTREIRKLLLRCKDPYTFFVLVDCNIQDPGNEYDEWYIGYLKDVQRFGVGRKLSGEGYNRMVWHPQFIAIPADKNVAVKESPSYRDVQGDHVDYHDFTMRDFLEKQIKWRIYKRFTIDYNNIPFDMTSQEREAQVKDIISTVLNAYESDDFVTISLKDVSFLYAQEQPRGYSAQELKRYRSEGRMRKPAF